MGNRKGFVKLALQTGVDIIPSFGFGEQHIFKMLNGPEGSRMRRFQEWVKRKLTFSPVIFTGRGVFQYLYGLLPYRRPINVVIGQPISVNKVENPTNAEIEELHQKYVDALRKLYEDHNPVYGDEKVKLII